MIDAEETATESRRWRWRPAGIGAIAGANTVVLVGLVLWLMIAVQSVPVKLEFLQAELLLGLIIVFPAWLTAILFGAGSGAFTAWLGRSAKLQTIFFALILAALIWLAAFMPMALTMLYLVDQLGGGAGAIVTLALQQWRGLVRLAVLVAAASLLATLWATSRAFSIPLFSKSRRLRSTADLGGEYERLKAKGVAFKDEPKAMGSTKFADFDDSCGNFIRLVEG